MDMQALTKSMDELAQMFKTRMGQFEGNLAGVDSDDGESTSPSIVADYKAFKSFVMKALECLRLQVQSLARQQDEQEQRSRRKILLVHGLPETNSEDTTALAVEVFVGRIKCEVTTDDISRSFRTGRSQPGKTRPILVAFRDLVLRDDVWYSKTALKGTGVTLSEFLTPQRHETFKTARERFGVSNSWTRDGCVVVLGGDGERHRVASIAELDGVPAPATTSADGPSSSRRDKRPKRAARKDNK